MPVPCLREVFQLQENQADFEAISARIRFSITYFGFNLIARQLKSLDIYPFKSYLLSFLKNLGFNSKID